MNKRINKIITKLEKTNNKLSKCINKIINGCNIDPILLLMFFGIFILLFFQHDVISMYFDDFGNGSLSYSFTVQGVEGTNFSVYDLFRWAGQIYMNWGGRIIYAMFILIPLFKFGITPYMILQALVITLIIYVIYKIVREYTSNKKLYLLPIILFVCYSLLDMIYLRHGMYWASASILYVFPLLPFLALIYNNIKICKKINNNEKVNYKFYIPYMIFLTFVATFSHEQIGIAVVSYLISFALLNHLKNYKKYLKIDIPNIATAIISYIALFAAPGNWVRMSTNVEFAKMSILDKITTNYPISMISIFGEAMNIYMAFLTIIMFGFILKIVYEKAFKKGEKKYYYLLISMPILVILGAIVKYTYQSDPKNIGIAVFGTLWFVTMLITSIIYLKDSKRLDFLSIMIAAVTVIFCLIMSPVLGGRTGIPYIFFIFLILGLFVCDIFYDNKNIFAKILIIIILAICTIKGGIRYYFNYEGYMHNKPINDLNFKILSNFDNSSEIRTIKLYKVENSWYGSTKSYEEPSMDYWVKEYFNIDHDVTFEWIDIYEDFR